MVAPACTQKIGKIHTEGLCNNKIIKKYCYVLFFTLGYNRMPRKMAPIYN